MGEAVSPDALDQPEPAHCIIVDIGQTEAEARAAYRAVNPDVPPSARFIYMRVVDGRTEPGLHKCRPGSISAGHDLCTLLARAQRSDWLIANIPPHAHPSFVGSKNGCVAARVAGTQELSNLEMSRRR